MKTFGDGVLTPQKIENSWTKVQTPDTGQNLGVGTSVPKEFESKNWTKVQTPASQKTNKVQTPHVKKFNNLPHIDMMGYYQFVTFRTHDSIDEFLKKIQNEDVDTKIKQYKIDTYVDSSKNGSYLNDEILEYLKKFFLSYDGKLYDLVAFCIMSNHIHILFKQKDDLKKIVKILKGSSSNFINKLLNKKGQFWESGYFDKAIRDEKHFMVTYEYIKNNPLKVGLGLDRFYGIYE